MTNLRVVTEQLAASRSRSTMRKRCYATRADVRPAAVVLSADDLEFLEETLEVLGNNTLMADIREALTNVEDAAVMTRAEALRLITKR
ncbi:hypothetical protein [Pseudofrankia asymbiotica]|uniref:Uncharacterized protein n=1 Tax=Pseudofrankia asymbiotica TaxID=1834516 RepID=A0A1V2IKN5_9ACTN|nr:hypothetical protein [Pseudofrankia asymbiotica]ONH33605.1 hypothetical protein BL253_00875 [Pseudofrankia asymbiotica]